MLTDRYGLAVEVRGERSITARGQARGRALAVAIDGRGARSELGRFFFGLNTISSRNRREKWHSELSVSCMNPARVTGTIESAVDVTDPAWKPGQYDPRAGRTVRADPPSLGERVLSPDIHERLMSIMDDVTIRIEPTAVLIEDDATAIPDAGANYVAGSVIHHYTGTPPPWPDRAVVGPPWWIDLLCDIADRLDG